MDDLLVVDSATALDASARGRVVVCGSHGALYPAWLAAQAGVRAIIMNDAGIGRHSAGVAGLAWLGGLGIAACAIDHRTGRIGDAADMLEHGLVSMANDVAAGLGCLPGHTARQAAAALLEDAVAPDGAPVPEIGVTRLRIANSGHREVWALDSAALARESDRRAILVTGSHGGLLGGREDDGVLAVDAFAALLNDAGGGKDDAGFARLPVLDARGIAAATVSCQTARIGDGRSSYDTGVLSRVNEVARRLDLKEGMSAREAVARLVGLG
ncbi:MAG TPA: hypothetical protein VFK48_14955 [Usitatibacter sp.]|nr:hypothetical protein [Usitatibacter sp.]